MLPAFFLLKYVPSVNTGTWLRVTALQQMFGEHPDRFAILLTNYLVAINQLTQGEKLVKTSPQIKVNNLGWTCRGESEIPFPGLSEGFKRSLRRRVFFFPFVFLYFLQAEGFHRSPH